VGRLTKSKKDAGEGVVAIKKTDTEYIKQVLALQATMQRVLCVAFPLSVEDRGKNSVDVLMGRAFQVGGADCRLQIADCRLQIADCRLQIAGCRLPVADCRLPVAGCRLPVAGCLSLVVRPIVPYS
jgi:hypothetical protein